MLTILIRAISRLNAFLGSWVVSPLALVIFAVMIWEVVARYVFSAPTLWATELSQLLFGVYIVLSGGWLLLHRGHVNVDILVARLPPRRRAALDMATSVMFFLFMAVLLKEGWIMASASFDSLERSHSAWNPPIWPVKAAIPLGIGLLFLQGLARFLQDLQILLGHAPTDTVAQGEPL
ncbi:TRAP transporter small permease subunit [Falsigemmobacter faecalis]|uniref:TRAP transporter small permease subunit n=1 Tax=Falsigemmobacter faecalis TaxID=2488730 RepID=UPI001F2A5715|nr:TRAP transporter small permease subunit [Falsigemmobacter faecalis]